MEAVFKCWLKKEISLAAKAINDFENICKFLAIGRIPPLIGAAAIRHALEIRTAHDDRLADGRQVALSISG